MFDSQQFGSNTNLLPLDSPIFNNDIFSTNGLYNGSETTQPPKQTSFASNLLTGLSNTSSLLRGDAVTSKGEDITNSILGVVADSKIPYASQIAAGLKVLMDVSTNFGNKAQKLNTISNADLNASGNSYNDFVADYTKANENKDNKYSIFNPKGLKEANSLVNKINNQTSTYSNIIDNSRKQLEKQAGMIGLMPFKTNNYYNGIPNTSIMSAKVGGTLIKAKYFLDNIKEKPKEIKKPLEIARTENVSLFKEGGKVNVIPDGAFHSRLNKMEVKGITRKGIPVISNEEGGVIDQQAEIERNEIIFTKEITDKLEKLYKDGSEEAAIEAGKILVQEILYNTDDKTGLIDSIKIHQQGGTINNSQQHLYIDPENGKVIDLGAAYGQNGFEYYTKLVDEYHKPKNPVWLNWAKQTVNPADYRNKNIIAQNLPEGFNIDENGIITDKEGNVYVTHRNNWALQPNGNSMYKHLEGINPISVKWRNEHGSLPTNATFYPVYSPHSRYIERKPEYVVTPEIAKREKNRAIQNYIKDNSKDYYEMTLFNSPYVRDVFAEYEAFKQNPDEYIAIPFNGNYSSYVDGGSKQIFFDRETYLNKMKYILSKIDKIGYRMSDTYSDVAPLKGKDSPILQLTEEQLNKIKKEVLDPNYLNLNRYYGKTPEDLIKEFNNHFNTIKSKPIHYVPTQQEAEQNAQVKFQYLDNNGNPMFYQQGGTIENKPTFEEWFNSIPKENKASNFDYKLAYEVLPLEELLNHAKDPKNNHLHSVSTVANDKGWFPFLKLGKIENNPELLGEFNWYNNSNEPEALKQRDNFDIVYDNDRYYYVPKQLNKND